MIYRGPLNHAWGEDENSPLKGKLSPHGHSFNCFPSRLEKKNTEKKAGVQINWGNIMLHSDQTMSPELF